MNEPIITKLMSEVGRLLAGSGITEIRQAQVPAPNVAVRPAIIYWPGKQTMEDEAAEHTLCYLDLEVMTLGQTDEDTFGEAHQLAADIVKALWADCSLGGMAHWIVEVDQEIYAGDITAPDFTIMQTFQIFYHHKIGDWTQQ